MPTPSSPEDRFQGEVRANLRRNYGAFLVHGLLGQTGFRLIQAPTFLPVYVELLSGSNLAVGAARALQSLGMFLSPLLGASVIEHRRRVLPAGFVIGGLMRLQVLGLALSGLLLSGQPALFSVFLFLLLFGFFMGMQGVVFNFLVSKVIPLDVRGRLMGLRNALAVLTGGAVAWMGGQLIELEWLGNGYASTFLVAFVLTAAGLATLGFMREPESPSVRERSAFGTRLRDLPALLRRDREFTHYFLARALATMGRMSVPFYVLYARTKVEIGGSEIGALTLAFLLAQGGMNLAWGAIADRIGFRWVFLASLVLWIASALALMASASLGVLVGVMVGLGAGLGGFMMASQNLVLEFGSRENLPARIAVANSAAELVGAIGPLAAGLLSDAFSYVAVFWTAIAFQLAAIVWVGGFVREPRRRG